MTGCTNPSVFACKAGLLKFFTIFCTACSLQRYDGSDPLFCLGATETSGWLQRWCPALFTWACSSRLWHSLQCSSRRSRSRRQELGAPHAWSAPCHRTSQSAARAAHRPTGRLITGCHLIWWVRPVLSRHCISAARPAASVSTTWYSLTACLPLHIPITGSELCMVIACARSEQQYVDCLAGGRQAATCLSVHQRGPSFFCPSRLDRYWSLWCPFLAWAPQWSGRDMRALPTILVSSIYHSIFQLLPLLLCNHLRTREAAGVRTECSLNC